MEDDTQQGPESLLPYDEWTEEALRHVMVRALEYAAANGLPGEHHFYVTFRTDHPGVSIPARLKAQYPQEMTIVLQHQFWDLMVDEAAGLMNVGLSFGGVPSTLRIPLKAITAFADPYVRHGMRFRSDLGPTAANAAPEAPPAPEPEAEPEAPPPQEPQAEAPQPETPQVVSLDAFRRRTPPKE
ncbi:SspB family protein [Limobrevibacterium gyesilva]|uniref:ClpXP protease specificity-enhancing factor SspB n=1 Tax=Limobrevibacterium gyesilva TaxID=2991712 RepID=A0AA41YLV8_9PROT|nr:ClpXP protease specificity-enhancing factor SspB [Limobrevibacterium gyesilva]MCW3475869.1 ClpXP protease specificity-enhancing factor SspB [Limobrevibacterium gyesilva]